MKLCIGQNPNHYNGLGLFKIEPFGSKATWADFGLVRNYLGRHLFLFSELARWRKTRFLLLICIVYNNVASFMALSSIFLESLHLKNVLIHELRGRNGISFICLSSNLINPCWTDHNSCVLEVLLYCWKKKFRIFLAVDFCLSRTKLFIVSHTKYSFHFQSLVSHKVLENSFILFCSCRNWKREVQVECDQCPCLVEIGREKSGDRHAPCRRKATTDEEGEGEEEGRRRRE